MPLSLASLRYRNILTRDGGPLEKLLVTERSAEGSRRIFHANAHLSTSLLPSWRKQARIYGDAHGSGTHALKTTACSIAVSESLERWAFFAECTGERKSLYGFDADPSTTGLAAFPGLTASPARDNARLEAIERWALVEWWTGRLRATARTIPQLPGRALELVVPFSDCAVALIWCTLSSGATAYGFAAARDFARAQSRARVELERNARVLRAPTASVPTMTIERRLLYFATPEGTERFHRRVAESTETAPVPAQPRPLVDRELRGPWTRYATVWRVLYEQTGAEHLDDDRDDFFLF